MTDKITAAPAPEEIDAPTSAEHAGPTPAEAPKPTSGRPDYDARLSMNMLMAGEPWFLVKGHDPAFAAAVRAYAAEIHRLSGPLENVESALQLADKGERFQPKRMPDSVRDDENERKQLRYQLSQRLRFTGITGRAPELIEAAQCAAFTLEKAIEQFEHYEAVHAAKGTDDGDAKARTNAVWAANCKAASVPLRAALKAGGA